MLLRQTLTFNYFFTEVSSAAPVAPALIADSAAGAAMDANDEKRSEMVLLVSEEIVVRPHTKTILILMTFRCERRGPESTFVSPRLCEKTSVVATAPAEADGGGTAGAAVLLACSG